MKIALIQDWLTGFAGGEQVLLALHEMYPDAPIYTSFYKPDKVPHFKKAEVIPSYLQKVPGLMAKEKVAIPLMPAAFESFDLKGFDVVISVGGGFSKGVITHPGQRHISYNHTPIRYIWRLGGDNRNEGRWDSALRDYAAHKMRIWDVVSASRVDQFIANSTTVQARIAKIYRMPSEVVSPPVDVEQFSVSEENEGYYLTIGRLVSYKRLDLIIEACNLTKRPLKIVGIGPEEKRLKELAAGVKTIEFLGRVSDTHRNKLYSKAKGFMFAAEEDAGIVPVEAMACGKAVIAYGKGGVTDVIEDGVEGILFAEQTADSLIDAIERFEKTVFHTHKIRTKAEQFTKAVFQEKMRNIIEFQS